MSYTTERIDGEHATEVGAHATERQALFAAIYQQPGQYQIRHGDRIVYRFSINRPSTAAEQVPQALGQGRVPQPKLTPSAKRKATSDVGEA